MKVRQFRQQLITEVRRLIKEEAIKISRDDLVKKIKDTDPRNTGKGDFFTVTFIKKDGSTRVMNGRLGVKKHLKGGTLKYDPVEKQLITVFDQQSGGYRSINIPGIISAKIGGNEYIVA